MITPRNLADSAKTHIITTLCTVCAVGVDIADMPIFRAPKNIIIVEAGIIPLAAYTGHADGSAWAIEKGATSIAGKTFNATADSTPPDVGAYASLGAISNANLLEGDVVTFSVTNGAGAASPICVVQVEYIVDEDV